SRGRGIVFGVWLRPLPPPLAVGVPDAPVALAVLPVADLQPGRLRAERPGRHALPHVPDAPVFAGRRHSRGLGGRRRHGATGGDQADREHGRDDQGPDTHAFLLRMQREDVRARCVVDGVWWPDPVNRARRRWCRRRAGDAMFELGHWRLLSEDALQRRPLEPTGVAKTRRAEASQLAVPLVDLPGELVHPEPPALLRVEPLPDLDDEAGVDVARPAALLVAGTVGGVKIDLHPACRFGVVFVAVRVAYPIVAAGGFPDRRVV